MPARPSCLEDSARPGVGPNRGQKRASGRFRAWPAFARGHRAFARAHRAFARGRHANRRAALLAALTAFLLAVGVEGKEGGAVVPRRAFARGRSGLGCFPLATQLRWCGSPNPESEPEALLRLRRPIATDRAPTRGWGLPHRAFARGSTVTGLVAASRGLFMAASSGAAVALLPAILPKMAPQQLRDRAFTRDFGRRNGCGGRRWCRVAPPLFPGFASEPP